MSDGMVDFVSGTPSAGSLDVTWIHGAAGEPPIQVHHYDEHTVILRQSKRLDFEAPFLFLLFGNDRALLLDTGATADPSTFPLRSTVDELIAGWLDRHPRDSYPLVVAHTHGHGDHVAADPQFVDRPLTTAVARDLDAVRAFFGFTDWPTGQVRFDLGGRVLELIGSPGHHAAAVTTYDPWTGLLLTGDTVLAGRLYVEDHAAYLSTLERLVAFAERRPVTHVFGTHVEMTSRAGRDYAWRATYQPDEHPPQLTVADLVAIRDAAAAATGRRGIRRYDDFILYNEPRRRDVLRLVARSRLHRLTHRR